MNLPTPEQILCAETNALPHAWLPEAGCLPMTSHVLMTTLANIEPKWLPRPEAETSPQFKQFIPYLIIRNSQGKIAAYPRKGSEKRLHGLWSIGIGGHVNPADADFSSTDSEFWNKTLHAGMQRELTEEFPEAADGKTILLGIIHESLSAVGRVHLGIVFLHEIAGSPHVASEELDGLCWVPSKTMGTAEWPLERFELWSQLSLQLLNTVSS